MMDVDGAESSQSDFILLYGCDIRSVVFGICTHAFLRYQVGKVSEASTSHLSRALLRHLLSPCFMPMA